MTEALIGVAAAFLAGALVSVVAAYLYFIATEEDFDATGMRIEEDEDGNKKIGT